MNIRQVEIFKAVMEHGSITKAAENLNIAQPSASKHLKSLEDNLKIKLFERTKNKLVPTTEGQALFDQVERVYTGLGFLEKFASDLRDSQHGEVSIAAMPLISQQWLPKHIAAFMASHHKVSFSLPVRSSSWIWSAVASRRVHVGIGLRPRSEVMGLNLTPLMRLPVVCLMPNDHPLAVNEAVTADQVRDTAHVSLRNFDQERLNLELLMEGNSPHQSRTVETFSSNVACELVRHGVGVGLVDGLSALQVVDDGLTYRLFEPAMHMDVCVITPEYWTLPLIARDVVDYLKSRADETQKRITSTLQA